MTNESQALTILAGAAAPLTTLAIFEQLKDCDTRAAAVVMMSTLKRRGLVEIAGKTASADGKLSQNLWRITGAGHRWLKDADEPQNGAGGRPASPRRAKKMQRRNAKMQRTAKRASHRGRPRLRTVRAAPGRWALTEDGAFVLLGAPEAIEISRDRARALVAFVRTLDEGAA